MTLKDDWVRIRKIKDQEKQTWYEKTSGFHSTDHSEPKPAGSAPPSQLGLMESPNPCVLRLSGVRIISLPPALKMAILMQNASFRHYEVLKGEPHWGAAALISQLSKLSVLRVWEKPSGFAIIMVFWEQIFCIHLTFVPAMTQWPLRFPKVISNCLTGQRRSTGGRSQPGKPWHSGAGWTRNTHKGRVCGEVMTIKATQRPWAETPVALLSVARGAALGALWGGHSPAPRPAVAGPGGQRGGAAWGAPRASAGALPGGAPSRARAPTWAVFAPPLAGRHGRDRALPRQRLRQRPRGAGRARRDRFRSGGGRCTWPREVSGTRPPQGGHGPGTARPGLGTASTACGGGGAQPGAAGAGLGLPPPPRAVQPVGGRGEPGGRHSPPQRQQARTDSDRRCAGLDALYGQLTGCLIDTLLVTANCSRNNWDSQRVGTKGFSVVTNLLA